LIVAWNKKRTHNDLRDAGKAEVATEGKRRTSLGKSQSQGESMKKPINKFAVALWVVAVIVLIGGVGSLVSMQAMLRTTMQQGDTIYEVVGSSWRIIAGSLLPAVQLAAFGVIIELIDQIRWNALHRTDREQAGE
jgi:hypothetical protein